ncbi:MAG: phosphate regulon sensor histidine kinase PhoR [Burkholderiaceae bacterium]
MSRSSIFFKFILFTSFIGLLVWVTGPVVGLSTGFFITLLAWWYSNLKLLALHRWLSHVPGAHVPSGSGLWDEVFSLLYRQQKSQSHQVQTLTHALVTFRRAAQAMPDGVITLSSDNHILWCNETAARMFGFDLSVDAGRNIANLVRAPEFQDYLQSEDWTKAVTVRMLRTEPKCYAIRLVQYGEGERLMLVRDVTQLERLETMRRDFVANVSHELKTPLTVLSGFLETIQTYQDLPATQRAHFFDLMNEQASRMKRLVEDLLTLSALESGDKAPLDTVVVLDPLFERLKNAAELLSQGKHHVHWNLESGVKLLGAETELASAFENLISNAIRYTPEGGQIEVEFTLWPNREDLQEARFVVQDTGIGIEAQHIPRLTERFYRVDRSRSRESGGTGLGLAIVKHVLTRHDGNLAIESSYGRGTTMTAILPARRVVLTTT